jgi:hypothetical protein
MPDHTPPHSEFDWRTTSFEGARSEQLRRWAQLPLERILMAIEEMEDITQALGTASADVAAPTPPSRTESGNAKPRL